MQHLYGCPILTPDAGFVHDHAVTIEAGRIMNIGPVADLPDAGERVVLEAGYLTPGFIDLQVNGGGGVLFNDAPDPAGVRAIAAAHRPFGATGLFPTLISDDLDVLDRAVDAVETAIAQDAPGILGVHLEGPFLNVAKKGVHNPEKFRTLDEDAIARLSRLKGGKTLVTLAPELTAPGQIQALVARGVVVAAGHTNADYDQARAAEAEGLSGYTHLFNAMSPLVSRAPGAVGAALASPRVWAGMIVDTHHVHPAALRVALKCLGPDRAVLVTDAMPTVGARSETFTLYGQTIRAEAGRLTTADGTLAGSHLDMMTAVKNAVAHLDVSLAEAVHMASTAPARAMGVADKTGSIAVGKQADLVHFTGDYQVVSTWIAGDRAIHTPAIDHVH